MKLILAFFLLFCALSDPWVDGSMHLPESNEVSIMDTHHHDCHLPEGCSEEGEAHTCHFGHCGFLLSQVFLANSPEMIVTLTEYSLFVPLAPTFGLKRPPKHS